MPTSRIVTDWGLDGVDPAAGVVTAGAAWEAGELDAAETAAGEVLAALAAAPAAGRTRALLAGGGAAAGLLLLLVAVVLVIRRRRRRGGRAAGVVHPVGPGATGSSGAGWPYATLPPDAPPSEPPGGPTSRDEGADRT